MNEANRGASDPNPRSLIDQPEARIVEPDKLGGNIVDPISDVVKSRSVLREELSDRRIGTERCEQLDVALADVQQHRLDSLLLDNLAVNERHAVGVLIQRDCRLKIVDCDADVVDCSKHSREDTRAAQPSSRRATAE